MAGQHIRRPGFWSKVKFYTSLFEILIVYSDNVDVIRVSYVESAIVKEKHMTVVLPCQPELFTVVTSYIFVDASDDLPSG